MPSNYSHSKLSTFEECKHKYKLKYIEFKKVDSKTPAFFVVGSVVHKALELLYKEVAKERIVSKEELNQLFEKEWGIAFKRPVLFQDKSESELKLLAWKYLEDFYKRYAPFDELGVLGVETKDKLKLRNGSLYDVRIDKLAFKDGVYFVCDYKTSSSSFSVEEASSDRQLGMYAFWVRSRFRSAKRVVLLWHMLARNEEVRVEQGEEELKRIEEGVIRLIEEIEQTKEFPKKPSERCAYCEYKIICEENKSINEFL